MINQLGLQSLHKALYFIRFLTQIKLKKKVLWERIYLRWQRNWSQFDRTLQTLNSWKQDEKRLVARLQALQQQQRFNLDEFFG